MPLVVPPVTFTDYQRNFTSGAAASATVVTASATPHTKGNWTQLFASTSFAVYEVWVMLSDVGVSTTNTNLLVDIGIGAAGTEVVLIPNLIGGAAAPKSIAQPGGQKYRFPLYIPPGVRVAARAQAATASDTVEVWVTLQGKPNGITGWVGGRVTAYGINTATSSGVAVASGLSDAEGTWVQITASTTDVHRWLCVGLDGGGDTTMQNADGAVDVGIGGAGAEVAIGEQRGFTATNQEVLMYVTEMAMPRSIAIGSRLAARVSHNSAGAQDYGVALYGV